MNKTIDYSPLKENRKFYLENKAQLLKKYNEKYILLYDCKVVNSSNDGALLSEEGISKYGAGNFCVQFCAKADPKFDVSHIVRVVHGA